MRLRDRRFGPAPRAHGVVAAVLFLAGSSGGGCAKAAPPSQLAATPSFADRAPDPRASTAAHEVTQALSASGAIQWATVAALLGDGTEACIDGRSDKPVLGTPGGDMGEILVGLSALERQTGQSVDERHLDAVFDAYAESFGRLYFHTDRHALGRMRDAFVALATRQKLPDLTQLEAFEAFLNAPPVEHRESLLRLAATPAYVGCAHLRSAMVEADRYGVRASLAKAVIESAYRLMWRNPRAIDFQVLEGEHRERVIVEVRLDHAVHAHSRVPLIVPHEGQLEMFVHHPDVAAFLRRETGTFFLEHAHALRVTAPAEAAYLNTLEALAEQQAHLTAVRVAKDLPTVHVIGHGHSVTVNAVDASLHADDLVGGAPGRK